MEGEGEGSKERDGEETERVKRKGNGSTWRGIK